MKTQKVFISHSNSTKDREFAKKLAVKLRDKGFETWNNAEITAGEEWESSLRKSLTEASAFIMLLSPNWSASPWPAFEYGAAQAFKKKVIPILLVNSEWTPPLMFRSMKMLDATKVDKNQIVSSIEEAIKN